MHLFLSYLFNDSRHHYYVLCGDSVVLFGAISVDGAKTLMFIYIFQTMFRQGSQDLVPSAPKIISANFGLILSPGLWDFDKSCSCLSL